jgi:hypothetical protein
MRLSKLILYWPPLERWPPASFEAVTKAAQADPDAAVLLIARDMISSGQPHPRGRKAALRDERRSRRRDFKSQEASRFTSELPLTDTCSALAYVPHSLERIEL